MERAIGAGHAHTLFPIKHNTTYITKVTNERGLGNDYTEFEFERFGRRKDLNFQGSFRPSTFFAEST
jgi:hypothetical protein